MELFCPGGTTACDWLESRYNILVKIWLQRSHPHVPLSPMLNPRRTCTSHPTATVNMFNPMELSSFRISEVRATQFPVAHLCFPLSYISTCSVSVCDLYTPEWSTIEVNSFTEAIGNSTLPACHCNHNEKRSVAIAIGSILIPIHTWPAPCQ